MVTDHGFQLLPVLPGSCVIIGELVNCEPQFPLGGKGVVVVLLDY